MSYEHGGDIYSREVEHDFSANINPLGIPKSVKKAISDSIEKCINYPDYNSTNLINAIAQNENIPFENIVCGNGAADLIYRIVNSFKPKKAIVLSPTFGEYEKALNESGCAVEHFLLNEKNGFSLDYTILKYLDDSIDMLFICNPNNPVGNLIEPKLLKEIAEVCRLKNILLVCDECFLDFSEQAQAYTAKNFFNENVIILKAFTKIYAIPGIRLGYAIFGDKEKSKIVKKTGQCWSVSVIAQAAGEAALSEKNYASETVKLIAEERFFLSEKLKSFGFKVYASSVNFILFRCDAPLDELLIKRKIALRNCGNYIGLNEHYFRTAVRSHNENALLINAIGEVLREWQSQ